MKITIKLKNGSDIVFFTDQTLNPIEMPYMAIGYGFNGSSTADPLELDKYWFIVDQLFKNNNIENSEYYTLISINL